MENLEDRLIERPVSVIVEERDAKSRWIKKVYKPVSAAPGVVRVPAWTAVNEGDGVTHYAVGTVELELHRKETEGYLHNLESERAALYVVMRPNEEADWPPYHLLKVTASPYEAQDYLDTGEEIVEAVEMPVGVRAWIEAFMDIHHQDVEFKKRKRDRAVSETPQFGKVPIFDPSTRSRLEDEDEGGGNA